VAHFTDPDEEAEGDEEEQIDKGLKYYEHLKATNQIKAMGRPTKNPKVNDATYLAYRLPDGRGKVRLNLCLGFRSDLLQGSTAQRVLHIDPPETVGEGEGDLLP
jgi:CRISPR/Cas system-associated endonuclease/helicase Cas3